MKFIIKPPKAFFFSNQEELTTPITSCPPKKLGNFTKRDGSFYNEVSITAIWWFVSVQIFQSVTSSKSCTDWTKHTYRFNRQTNQPLFSLQRFKPFLNFSKYKKNVWFLLLITWWIMQVTLLAQRTVKCDKKLLRDKLRVNCRIQTFCVVVSRECLPPAYLSCGLALSVKYDIYKQF